MIRMQRERIGVHVGIRDAVAMLERLHETEPLASLVEASLVVELKLRSLNGVTAINARVVKVPVGTLVCGAAHHEEELGDGVVKVELDLCLGGVVLNKHVLVLGDERFVPIVGEKTSLLRIEINVGRFESGVEVAVGNEATV